MQFLLNAAAVAALTLTAWCAPLPADDGEVSPPDARKPVCSARVPITVDFGNARPTAPYPVRAGVPFARGELAEVENIRLVKGQKEADCQLTRMAVWPDGSVKWVLVEFFAKPGQSYTIEYGTEITRAAASSSLKATTDAAGVFTVDTGPLRAVIRPDGSAFLDEVHLNGKPIVKPGPDRRNFLDFIHTDDTAKYHTMTRQIDGELDQSEAVITELAVEAAGPIRATVLVRGKYKYRTVGSTYPPGLTEPNACPFTLRLTFYRASAMVEVEHFFAYEGDPDHDFVSQIGLSLPLAKPSRGPTAFGGHQAKHQTGSPTALLFQQSCDNYLLMTGANASDQKVSARGTRAAGWVDVSSDDVGVLMGIRWFWKQYAKALSVDRQAGSLTAHLWPAQAAPLDYRRYARVQAVGEAGMGNAKGTGKVHELVLLFHQPDAPPDELAQTFAAFDAKPIAIAPTERYADTRVLGHYRQRREGVFDELEEVIQRPIDYWKFCQERFRWYGFLDYGDVQSCYNVYNKQNRWDNDYGRWGWAGGDQQGRLNYALLLQFLRTGDRSNFEFAEANVRHVHSVDAVHTEQYKTDDGWENVRGAVHRHNAQHWGCGYTAGRGAHPVGAKIYYYLTGNGWAKDTLDEVLALSERGGVGELPGPAMQSYICAWERTGEEKYKHKLYRLIENARWTGRRSGWDTMMTAAFGMYDAMIEYIDLTGDASLKRIATAFAENCTDQQVLRSWTWPGGYFRIYAETYRLTGDQRWKDVLRQASDKTVAAMRRCGSYLPRDDWPGRAESTAGGGKPGATSGVGVDGNTLRDIPFAIDALIAGKGAAK